MALFFLPFPVIQSESHKFISVPDHLLGAPFLISACLATICSHSDTSFITPEVSGLWLCQSVILVGPELLLTTATGSCVGMWPKGTLEAVQRKPLFFCCGDGWAAGDPHIRNIPEREPTGNQHRRETALKGTEEDSRLEKGVHLDYLDYQF